MDTIGLLLMVAVAPGITVMIVSKLAGRVGFQVLPRRLDRGEDLVLDQSMPTHCARLRTST